MQLFLRDDLVKSHGLVKPGTPKASGQNKPGEQRGGNYIARVQTGMEKDGSPKYRYFMSQEEFDSYLKGKHNKRDAKEHAKDLDTKVDREHYESKRSQDKESRSLLKRQEKVKKSLDLIVLGVKI